MKKIFILIIITILSVTINSYAEINSGEIMNEITTYDSFELIPENNNPNNIYESDIISFEIVDDNEVQDEIIEDNYEIEVELDDEIQNAEIKQNDFIDTSIVEDIKSILFDTIYEVEIFSDIDNPKFEQTVTLYSIVTATSDANFTYQWQVDKGDGWRNISKANKGSFIFVYNEKNAYYRWRLAVSII